MLFYAALVFYVFAEGDPVGISKRDLVLEKKLKSLDYQVVVVIVITMTIINKKPSCR